jgi:hypothetical protein
LGSTAVLFFLGGLSQYLVVVNPLLFRNQSTIEPSFLLGLSLSSSGEPVHKQPNIGGTTSTLWEEPSTDQSGATVNQPNGKEYTPRRSRCQQESSDFQWPRGASVICRHPTCALRSTVEAIRGMRLRSSPVQPDFIHSNDDTAPEFTPVMPCDTDSELPDRNPETGGTDRRTDRQAVAHPGRLAMSRPSPDSSPALVSLWEGIAHRLKSRCCGNGRRNTASIQSGAGSADEGDICPTEVRSAQDACWPQGITLRPTACRGVLSSSPQSRQP